MSIIPQSIKKLILQAKDRKQRIVLCTGVFDLFHTEHAKFLTAAKEQGDMLLVGIESDSRVREMKGADRPIWLQQKRLETVLAHPAVSGAFILPEDFSTPLRHEALIQEVSPDILAISSHSPHQEAKKRILEKNGAQLRVVLEHNPAVSTSQLLAQD